MHESQRISGQEFSLYAVGMATGLAVTIIGIACAVNRLRKGEAPKARDFAVSAIGASVASASFAKADKILDQAEGAQRL